jgi:hypothetical protein
MIMKIDSFSPVCAKRGYILLMVLILVGVSLMSLAGIYMYASTNSKLSQRANDYYSALGGAEAATEKVLAQATLDFRNYGAGYLMQQLDTYRQTIPTTNELSAWKAFTFMDLSGANNRTDVQYIPSSDFVPLGGTYGQLKAFKDRLRILSNVRTVASVNPVVGSVYQDIELTKIPIFQWAIFYNVTLEFTPQPPMTVYGPVHCNTNIYMNPAGPLTFMNDVTSAGTIVAGAIAIGPLNVSLGGTVTYNGRHDSGVSVMNLPIGTNSTPAAVHQVVEFPPSGENYLSTLGQVRYYNQADMVMLVSNSTTTVKSGRWNNFGTVLSSNEVSFLLCTTNSFYNKRESKWVKSIDLNIANLVTWNLTNTTVRPSLPMHDITVVYVADFRTQAATNESGIRLINGSTLPPHGLTVATFSPLYIQGNYNCPSSALGTTNTMGTVPASVAGDAITILSTVWQDVNGTNAISGRIAANTTVNAAVLAGIVSTTTTTDSGGVENYFRYLEDWTSKTHTYNGSMVSMYYSQIATAPWGLPANAGGPDHYNPPNRNWSLDQNFQYGDKLPPRTPALVVLNRAYWRTPAAFTTNVIAGY